MKRTDSDLFSSLSRQKSFRVLVALGFLYIILVIFELPIVLKNGPARVSLENAISSRHEFLMDSEEHLLPYKLRPERKIKELPKKPLISSLNLTAGIGPGKGTPKSAKRALELGQKLWFDVELRNFNQTGSKNQSRAHGKKVLDCPGSISITGDELSKKGGIMVLPCGLTLGSHVTVIGKPRAARNVTVDGDHKMVSGFVMELLGLKMAEDEEPPKILYLNPRLKGDWSGWPVIEHNSCYRMQWGRSQRCVGRRSSPDKETVDGLVKCEKWHRDGDNWLDEPVVSGWFKRLTGQRDKKTTIDWSFPFEEEKIFVLTLSAGLEGYHINVDGRHVTSFPYRPGFTLADATGLSLSGDVDVVSIFAASLPTLLPTYAQKHLDFSDSWRAPPVPDGPVELFIGILSAGSHFGERMAVRKSWLQHELIRSSRVVARFIVALHRKTEVNVQVKKEAEFFGDIVIVPYMDHYDLVVLKTVAICEFGVRSVSAKYVMKGDDDTFVRVDAIIDIVKKVGENKSLYIGNMNVNHSALRSGKWAVTFEEWPEEVYPTYANGPGYIISSDIANSIVSEFEKSKLRLFKMEDVSMGMWVEKFSESKPVDYVHSLRFCQFGCIENYITAHYQSARQMICLWNNLRRLGTASCCNDR
ncbi:hypothetical protein CASFOL_038320 [Castilleja foliolosa]|uniref:Galectin domain-containing protein n=1 Tax=Castilleja foliolosa TaxID=1961234 RepID=A0ABD3BL52_9LAMI